MFLFLPDWQHFTQTWSVNTKQAAKITQAIDCFPLMKVVEVYPPKEKPSHSLFFIHCTRNTFIHFSLPVCYVHVHVELYLTSPSNIENSGHTFLQNVQHGYGSNHANNSPQRKLIKKFQQCIIVKTLDYSLAFSLVWVNINQNNCNETNWVLI